MNIIQTKDEILDVLDEARIGVNTGVSKFPAMIYEDGVTAALEWILSMSTSNPMED